MSNTLTISDDSFDNDVLASTEPVLVDYWAEWCGPCKMVAPVLEELASTYTGRLKVAKLNIDENAGTAAKVWYSRNTYFNDLQKWRSCCY